MTKSQFISISVASDGSLIQTEDESGQFVTREAYESLLESAKQRRYEDMSNELMSECMSSFREDMIECGIIGPACPPMNMTEGVMGYINTLAIKLVGQHLSTTRDQALASKLPEGNGPKP